VRAGSLRHEIVLQTNTPAKDTNHAAIDSWSTLATVRAKIEPLTGSERFEAMKVSSEISHKVTIRYLSTVTAATRILWGSRILKIEAPLNIDERSHEMVLLCSEPSGTLRVS
jgi:SPP1 family predicted phage head-tail adaptor